MFCSLALCCLLGRYRRQPRPTTICPRLRPKYWGCRFSYAVSIYSSNGGQYWLLASVARVDLGSNTLTQPLGRHVAVEVRRKWRTALGLGMDFHNETMAFSHWKVQSKDDKGTPKRDRCLRSQTVLCAKYYWSSLFILLPEHNGSMRYVIVPIPNGMLTVSPYNTISGSNIRLSFRGGNS